MNEHRQLGDVRRDPSRLIARVKLAQANNILAEISKSSSCAVPISRANGCYLQLPLPTNWCASARPGRCQSRYRWRELRTRDVYRLRARSSCQPQNQAKCWSPLECAHPEKIAGLRSRLPRLRSGRSTVPRPRLPRFPKLSCWPSQTAPRRIPFLMPANAQLTAIWFFGRAVARRPVFPQAYRSALSKVGTAGRDRVEAHGR
jgi:hypothetical protein